MDGWRVLPLEQERCWSLLCGCRAFARWCPKDLGLLHFPHASHCRARGGGSGAEAARLGGSDEGHIQKDGMIPQAAGLYPQLLCGVFGGTEVKDD